MRVRDRDMVSLLPEDAKAYYLLWLGAGGRSHDAASAVSFIRAHKAMFGRQVDVFERGYQTWLSRRAVADSVDVFAEYLSPRYERWRESLLASDMLEVIGSLHRQDGTLAA